MEAEALVDTLAATIAEVKVETLADLLGNGEVEGLVDTLDDMLAEGEAVASNLEADADLHTS